MTHRITEDLLEQIQHELDKNIDGVRRLTEDWFERPESGQQQTIIELLSDVYGCLFIIEQSKAAHLAKRIAEIVEFLSGQAASRLEESADAIATALLILTSAIDDGGRNDDGVLNINIDYANGLLNHIDSVNDSEQSKIDDELEYQVSVDMATQEALKNYYIERVNELITFLDRPDAANSDDLAEKLKLNELKTISTAWIILGWQSSAAQLTEIVGLLDDFSVGDDLADIADRLLKLKNTLLYGEDQESGRLANSLFLSPQNIRQLNQECQHALASMRTKLVNREEITVAEAHKTARLCLEAQAFYLLMQSSDLSQLIYQLALYCVYIGDNLPQVDQQWNNAIDVIVAGESLFQELSQQKSTEVNTYFLKNKLATLSKQINLVEDSASLIKMLATPGSEADSADDDFEMPIERPHVDEELVVKQPEEEAAEEDDLVAEVIDGDESDDYSHIRLLIEKENIAELCQLASPDAKKAYYDSDQEQVVDEEIQLIFKEEFSELVDQLSEMNQNSLIDKDNLPTLRRIFHTLKGSGRMAQHVSLGEFAWRYEALLNHLLDQEIKKTAKIEHFVADAVNFLKLIAEADALDETRGAMLQLAVYAEEILDRALSEKQSVTIAAVSETATSNEQAQVSLVANAAISNSDGTNTAGIAGDRGNSENVVANAKSAEKMVEGASEANVSSSEGKTESENEFDFSLTSAGVDDDNAAGLALGKGGHGQQAEGENEQSAKAASLKQAQTSSDADGFLDFADGSNSASEANVSGSEGNTESEDEFDFSLTSAGADDDNAAGLALGKGGHGQHAEGESEQSAKAASLKQTETTSDADGFLDFADGGNSASEVSVVDTEGKTESEDEFDFSLTSAGADDDNAAGLALGKGGHGQHAEGESEQSAKAASLKQTETTSDADGFLDFADGGNSASEVSVSDSEGKTESEDEFDFSLTSAGADNANATGLALGKGGHGQHAEGESEQSAKAASLKQTETTSDADGFLDFSDTTDSDSDSDSASGVDVAYDKGESDVAPNRVNTGVSHNLASDQPTLEENAAQSIAPIMQRLISKQGLEALHDQVTIDMLDHKLSELNSSGELEPSILQTKLLDQLQGLNQSELKEVEQILSPLLQRTSAHAHEEANQLDISTNEWHQTMKAVKELSQGSTIDTNGKDVAADLIANSFSNDNSKQPSHYELAESLRASLDLDDETIDDIADRTLSMLQPQLHNEDEAQDNKEDLGHDNDEHSKHLDDTVKSFTPALRKIASALSAGEEVSPEDTDALISMLMADWTHNKDEYADNNGYLAGMRVVLKEALSIESGLSADELDGFLDYFFTLFTQQIQQESTETAETTETTEAAESAEAAETAKSAEAAETAKAAEAAEAAEAAKAAETAKSAEAAEAAETAKSAEAAETAKTAEAGSIEQKQTDSVVQEHLNQYENIHGDGITAEKGNFDEYTEGSVDHDSSVTNDATDIVALQNDGKANDSLELDEATHLGANDESSSKEPHTQANSSKAEVTEIGDGSEINISSHTEKSNIDAEHLETTDVESASSLEQPKLSDDTGLSSLNTNKHDDRDGVSADHQVEPVNVGSLTVNAVQDFDGQFDDNVITQIAAGNMPSDPNATAYEEELKEAQAGIDREAIEFFLYDLDDWAERLTSAFTNYLNGEKEEYNHLIEYLDNLAYSASNVAFDNLSNSALAHKDLLVADAELGLNDRGLDEKDSTSLRALFEVIKQGSIYRKLAPFQAILYALEDHAKSLSAEKLTAAMLGKTTPSQVDDNNEPLSEDDRLSRELTKLHETAQAKEQQPNSEDLSLIQHESLLRALDNYIAITYQLEKDNSTRLSNELKEALYDIEENLTIYNPHESFWRLLDVKEQLITILPDNAPYQHDMAEILRYGAELIELYADKLSAGDNSISQVDEQETNETIDRILTIIKQLRGDAQIEEHHETEVAKVEDDIAQDVNSPDSASDDLSEEEVEFVWDDDLIEIFAEEAQELLTAMRQALDENISTSATQQKIQRTLHTLKGGARMVELFMIGDTAHLMESVVELIATLDEGDTKKAQALLEEGLEEQTVMLDSVLRHELPKDALELNQKIRTFLEANGVSVPEVAHKQQVLRSESEHDKALAGTEQKDGSTELNKENILYEKAETEAQNQASRQIRVSEELLKWLSSTVGEAGILQVAMDEKARGTEYGITELERITQRIDEQLRRLTSRTESQILFRREQTDYGDEFDPLELDRFSEIQQLSRQLTESIEDLKNIHQTMEEDIGQFRSLGVQQNLILHDAQDALVSTQLMKFEAYAGRLRRLVRQVAQDAGKQVELLIDGADVAIERHLIDDLLTPLEHLIRNAIAHGLEKATQRMNVGKPRSGTIKIDVKKIANELSIRVIDDGAGINYDAIRESARRTGQFDESRKDDEDYLNYLLMQAGISSTKKLNQLSGRGIGMNVVNDLIQRKRGRITIHSISGRGCEFHITVPLGMSVMDILVVEIAGDQYAVPMVSVGAIVQLDRNPTDSAAEEEAKYRYNGKDYTILPLGDYFAAYYETAKDIDKPLGLIVNSSEEDDRRLIKIDHVIQRMEVVVKDIRQQTLFVPGVLGASVMADGSVLPILDVAELIGHTKQVELVESKTADVQVRKTKVMVVDDSITMRKIGLRLLERNDYEAIAAKDGLEALELLPQFEPDIILLDIEMPRMDGYEFTYQMRAQKEYADTKIIMITSRTGDKHRAKAIELGVDHYLGKPYQEEELTKLLGELSQAQRTEDKNG